MAGTFDVGTLQVHSYDGANVVFTLANTPTAEFDANGTYTATVCPTSN
jgi:hypothetical protein